MHSLPAAESWDVRHRSGRQRYRVRAEDGMAPSTDDVGHLVIVAVAADAFITMQLANAGDEHARWRCRRVDLESEGERSCTVGESLARARREHIAAG